MLKRILYWLCTLLLAAWLLLAHSSAGRSFWLFPHSSLPEHNCCGKGPMQGLPLMRPGLLSPIWRSTTAEEKSQGP
jgi:hypothetical protein